MCIYLHVGLDGPGTLPTDNDARHGRGTLPTDNDGRGTGYPKLMSRAIWIPGSSVVFVFYIRIRKHASRILWIFAYDCMNKSMLVVRALYIYIYIYIYMYIHVYVFVVDIS